MSTRTSPRLSSVLGKKRGLISSSLKDDDATVQKEEKQSATKQTNEVLEKDQTSPVFTIISHPSIPPSLNMKQEPESKKRRMNGVRNDLNVIVSLPESFSSQKESKGSESPWEKDILQADLIRHEILSTRTTTSVDEDEKHESAAEEECNNDVFKGEIDIVTRNISTTLLDLHKSRKPLISTKSPLQDVQYRSMSPKMRWKVMNNTTPRSGSILKSFIFDGLSAPKMVKSPSDNFTNSNDENIATAAVASVMYGENNITNNSSTVNYKLNTSIESPTNVNVLVEAATRISKPIDSIRHHMQMINANGGKSLTPTKSKNLLKQLETAANMLERTTKRKIPVRRVRWTSEEDERLKKLVKKYNGRQWKLVAQGIGKRSAAQCRQRWAGLCCPNKTKRACKWLSLSS
jgi:hypothetical protein